MRTHLLKKIGRQLDVLAGVGIEETFFYELEKGVPLPGISRPDILLVQLGRKQLPEFCELSRVKPKAVERRWLAHDRCYLAYVEHRLAHFSWVKSEGVHRISEADISLTVEPGHFWIYHCRTAAWARGRHIYPSVLQGIVHDYFGAGCFCAHIHTARTNPSSRRGIEKAGFHYVFSKKAVRIGSHWFAWESQS